MSENVIPQTVVQTRIVYLSLYRLSFCGWKGRHAVARMLQAIYRTDRTDGAQARLAEFASSPPGKK